MRHTQIVAVVISAVFGAGLLRAAPFQNLDFEQATIVGIPSGDLPTTTALPHWTVTGDGAAVSIIGDPQALEVLTGSWVKLESSQIFDPSRPAGQAAIAGNFSVGLSEYPGTGINTVAISQTGDIPADAKTLLFEVRPAPGVANRPLVLLDGAAISLLPVSISSGFTLMAGDISAFAGTTRELTFAAANFNYFDLDTISFSTTATPEPASLGLLAGMIPLWATRRQLRRFPGAQSDRRFQQ